MTEKDSIRKSKNTKKPIRKSNISETINNDKCLLIQVYNNCFFTNKKNVKYLVEASKAINASLHIVHVKNASLIPINEIHMCINNPNYINPTYEYIIEKTLLNKEENKEENKVLQTNSKLPHITSKEIKIIAKEKINIAESKKIRNIIRSALLEGRPINNNDLFELIKDFQLPKNKARYYINYVKKTMIEEGYVFSF